MMDIPITFVIRIGFGVIDKISVEVSVVFRDSPDIGKTVTIKCMHHHHAGIWRTFVYPAFLQIGNLTARTTKTLIAMGSRDDHDNFRQGWITENGYISIDSFAVGACAIWIKMGFDNATSSTGCVQELRASLKVIIRKIFSNHGSFLLFREIGFQYPWLIEALCLRQASAVCRLADILFADKCQEHLW